MEIVTGEQAPTLEHEAVRQLLHEMAAVARTIFAVPAGPERDEHPADVPGDVTVGGRDTVPGVPSLAAVPGIVQPTASPIPVPGAAILQEIAFLDE